MRNAIDIHNNYFRSRAVDVVSKRQVAIKIVENIEENIEEVLQEYQILTDHSLHPNIPQLYGAFRSDLSLKTPLTKYIPSPYKKNPMPNAVKPHMFANIDSNMISI